LRSEPEAFGGKVQVPNVTGGDAHKTSVLSNTGYVQPGREFQTIRRMADNVERPHHWFAGVFAKGSHSLQCGRPFPRIETRIDVDGDWKRRAAPHCISGEYPFR
jgi:hypothetical protein